MPFEVNHALWGNIETQVTDGIRMAILSGFYKPGDIPERDASAVADAVLGYLDNGAFPANFTLNTEFIEDGTNRSQSEKEQRWYHNG